MSKQMIDKAENAILHTYNRFQVVFDKGEGVYLYDTDGKQYLCCHSPNQPCEECKERTVLLSVAERNGTLCIK